MSTTPTDTMRDTLQRVVDFLAAHPDVPPPYVSIYDHAPHKADLRWYLHINGKGGPAKQKAAAQSIIRDLGGKWDKESDRGDDSMRFTQIRDGLDMEIAVTREAVCERVVVGTETVTIPATEAQEAQPERTVEREVVEWRCGSLFADAEAAS